MVDFVDGSLNLVLFGGLIERRKIRLDQIRASCVDKIVKVFAGGGAEREAAAKEDGRPDAARESSLESK